MTESIVCWIFKNGQHHFRKLGFFLNYSNANICPRHQRHRKRIIYNLVKVHWWFFLYFFCVLKLNVQRNLANVSMFACITVLNSKYMKPFWHDCYKFYTRNSSTLGLQSNVNEDDTSQWKLWIGIYLKCIHEQGEYFLHHSKNKRNRCINLLLY